MYSYTTKTLNMQHVSISAGLSSPETKANKIIFTPRFTINLKLANECCIWRNECTQLQENCGELFYLEGIMYTDSNFCLS